jgi:hypothetical protein
VGKEGASDIANSESKEQMDPNSFTARSPFVFTVANRPSGFRGKAGMGDCEAATTIGERLSCPGSTEGISAYAERIHSLQSPKPALMVDSGAALAPCHPHGLNGLLRRDNCCRILNFKKQCETPPLAFHWLATVLAPPP